jgi:hypothetical protein
MLSCPKRDSVFIASDLLDSFNSFFYFTLINFFTGLFKASSLLFSFCFSKYFLPKSINFSSVY